MPRPPSATHPDPFPADFAERVYAGILGKIVGVYLGRPFEGWTHERITAELGEIHGYVHHRFGLPIVQTDDDISGTFTFLRALPDHGYSARLTSSQIGQTWLNYIIEDRTVLWWGGMGRSTEHTAYLRLADGVPAPDSGSSRRNGAVVAEQIGAEIFADGWAMVAPGDPERAADFAEQAARVSHDGEAVYAARVVAAMESQAFIDGDLTRLLDRGLSLIPSDCTVRRVIDDVREWHARDGDWNRTRARIDRRYGYHRFSGGGHVVPNHAIIVLALLYGAGDLHRSLSIAASAGWDTDCNAGNVGCLLGIRGGLAAFDGGPNWRDPVGDRLYISSADGGRSVTDAVLEARHVVDTAHRLAGLQPDPLKGGARFTFAFPGATQGFAARAPSQGRAWVENVSRPTRPEDRVLALRYRGIAPHEAVRVATPTLPDVQALAVPHYCLQACPTLYPGQIVRSRVEVGGGPVTLSIFVETDPGSNRRIVDGPVQPVPAGEPSTLEWTVPDTGGAPITAVGLTVHPGDRIEGDLLLDWLTWGDTPTMILRRPEGEGTLWRRVWVNGASTLTSDEWAFTVTQSTGRGLVIHGSRQWSDYTVSTAIVPRLAAAFGLAARVQGMRRYYALILDGNGTARLVKVLDGERELARAPAGWNLGHEQRLSLRVEGARVTGRVDDRIVLEAEDRDDPLLDGAIALVCDEGCIGADTVAIVAL